MLCKKDDAIDGIVIDDWNGWAYTDALDFNQYINKILENPNILKKMSENSLKSVERFSVDNFAKSIEEIYELYISKHNKDCNL